MTPDSSPPTSRHPRVPRRGTPRAALVVLAALAPVLGLLVVAPPVSATDSAASPAAPVVGSSSHTVHKSYVCKYVGKPGVDERLQTGRNPIWVDNHALTGKATGVVHVGDTFVDKQGKSVVIVANTAKLTPEPGVASCPAPVGPTKVTATAPSATAPTCSAHGVLVVPTSTASITYTSVPAGTGPGTYTVTAKAGTGYVLVGTSSWTVTVLPRLTGQACPITVTPVRPTVVASTACDVQGSYTIPSTTGITYLLHGTAIAAGTYQGPASGTVTATAKSGYTLSTTTWSFTLSVPAAATCAQTVVTVVTPVNPTVAPSTTCEVQGSYTIPSTTGITYLLHGTTIAAGTYQGPASGTVTATAKSGYTLSTTTWSFTLSVPAAATCPVVEAPTTTTPTTTAPTTSLPATGSPVSALAGAGALSLALGLALYVAGSRRPAVDIH